MEGSVGERANLSSALVADAQTQLRRMYTPFITVIIDKYKLKSGAQ